MQTLKFCKANYVADAAKETNKVELLFVAYYIYSILLCFQTEDPLKKLGRNALIGFISSVVSDSISNSLRVIKTTRQTFPQTISYLDTVRHVIEKDGLIGLFGRGLKTRYYIIQEPSFMMLYRVSQQVWDMLNITF